MRSRDTEALVAGYYYYYYYYVIVIALVISKRSILVLCCHTNSQRQLIRQLPHNTNSTEPASFPLSLLSIAERTRLAKFNITLLPRDMVT